MKGVDSYLRRDVTLSKKTILLSLMTVCLSVGLAASLTTVNAVDFDGQENKYIQLCSSSKLTSSQQKTCKEFHINYICLFNYLFISSQMSAKPYFIGSTGILLLW